MLNLFQQSAGPSGMIVDLTSNEKAVHGDFYNGKLYSNTVKTYLISFFKITGFNDLCDDEDLS